MWNYKDLAAARVAEGQLGLLHREDLRSVGISNSGIHRRVSCGLLTQVQPSLYTYAGTPSFPRQKMLEEVLSVGSTAALSHDSAAYEWGLINRSPDRSHVVVRRWQREHRDSSIVHESLDLLEADCTTVDGVPVTLPVRTVVDLGATSPWLVERALSEGIRSELFTAADVARFVARVARRGRSGVGVIRPFLLMHEVVIGRTESLLEDRFLRVLFDREIQLPQSQFEVLRADGSIVCRADFAYPDRRLLIEVDGRSYHSDTVAFQRDRAKQNETQGMGWRTLRFTWHDVTLEPDRTATTVTRWRGG